LLVDQQGQPRCVLQPGERKSIATDRIILIPGPPDEIAIVRDVFRLYVVERLSPAEIAKLLNDRSVPWQDERGWSRNIISNIVSNPKYIGTNVSNRHSGKLRHRRVRNPQEMWIQRENAFEGIVDPVLFRQAEALSASRTRFYSNEELLQHLREFAEKYGTLTERQISADPAMPCSEVYNTRFGGLLEAYKLIGYQPTRDYSYVARDRKLLPMRKNLVAAISAVIVKAGSSVRQDARTKLLVINKKCKLRVSVARCRLIGQSQSWLLRVHSPLNPHLTVIARLAPGDSVIRDYYVFPRETETLTQITVAPFNSVAVDRYRFKDLSFLVDLCKLDPRAPPTVGESEQEVRNPKKPKIRPHLAWLSGARTST
jgi:hypothetical protein